MTKDKQISEFTDSELSLINAISKTNKNRSSKNELCALTGMSEKDIINTVSSLRQKGIPVCSSSSQAGYFIAQNKNDIKEIRHTAAEYESRAHRMLSIAHEMLESIRRINEKDNGQEYLF